MNVVQRIIVISLALILLVGLLSQGADALIDEKDFDLLIKGGRIVDGTGNPWFYGDVGIRNGRIVAIGNLTSARAARVINAFGKIVAPGFIDVHAHIEGDIEARPLADSYLRMGVTSVITGNCGASQSPLGEWFGKLEKQGISINVGSLVGHNKIRRLGMNGDFDRPPTA